METNPNLGHFLLFWAVYLFFRPLLTRTGCHHLSIKELESVLDHNSPATQPASSCVVVWLALCALSSLRPPCTIAHACLAL